MFEKFYGESVRGKYIATCLAKSVSLTICLNIFDEKEGESYFHVGTLFNSR